jgi:antitoxin VapB
MSTSKTASLNIKNPETYKLARQLARETGESLTAAVTTALRERLDIVRRRRKSEAIYDAIHSISERSAKLLQGPPLDHGEMLYDENGLPK